MNKHKYSPFILLFCVISGLLLTSCASHYRYNPQMPLVSVKENRTPTSFIPFKPTPKGLKPLIMVDAGHGGKDLGAHANQPIKYQEKDLTLSTATILKDFLISLGYSVKMTRSTDDFISLDGRANLANSLKPALYVSVHYNSAPNAKAEGIEVYYYKSDKNPDRTAKSKDLAEAVLEKVIHNTGAKSRGIRHGNFAVIRETHMPAILIEGGFLTNANEVEKIKTAFYLKKLAWGIALGVEEYLKNKF